MSAPLLGIIRCTPVPVRRVFVRDPHHRVADFALGVLATQTHEQRLGPMALTVTVRLDNGVQLTCPPHWVRPALNLTTLFSLPAA